MSKPDPELATEGDTTHIIVDCNEWIRLKWLGSPVGLKFLSLLQGAKTVYLAIPEVLEMELDKHRARSAKILLEKLHSAVDEVGVVTGNPLAGGIVTLTEEAVEVGIRNRLTRVSRQVVYPPLTLDEVRNALTRINNETPPNGPKNQQAKDSLLWEACVSLSRSSIVNLVTGDGGFYKNRNSKLGLADALLDESVVASGRLNVFASLEALIQALFPESSVESEPGARELDLKEVLADAAINKLNQSQIARDLRAEPSLRGVFVNYFRGESPHTFVVSFTVFYYIAAASVRDGEAAISGECTLDTKEPAVKDISFSSVNWKIPGLTEKEIWTQEIFAQ